jgi:cyanophycin synthetase
MIAIMQTRCLRWRNAITHHPVATAELEFDKADSWSPETLSLAQEVIAEALPSLPAPPAQPRIADFLVAVALAIQQEWDIAPPVAGMARSGETGLPILYYAYGDRFLAHGAAEGAVALANHLAGRRELDPAELVPLIKSLEAQFYVRALDQTTRAIARAADDRGALWTRLSARGRTIAIGMGARRRRVLECVLDDEGGVAQLLSRDKSTTLELLDIAGIPVGRYALARNEEQAVAAAERVGYPVALKSVLGSKGKQVLPYLTDEAAVRGAAKRLATENPALLVQSFFPGDDHRILVVDGHFVAAARRIPAEVVGDGVSSLRALIDQANRDPRRGHDFMRLMNRIEIDAAVKALVADQGISLFDVPEAGRRLRLQRTANISTGGTAEDVSDVIHPDNARMAERAALRMGLRVAGVDFITTDITRSWRAVGGGVCEINHTPGLRPHWIADPERDVVSPILDALFPQGRTGRIPTAMITGTNGKSTTTLMLSRILKAAGHTPGAAITDGVIIDGEWIIEGDVAGAPGAEAVLSDPSVTAAALETARGGLLQSGVTLEHCDVAALLNVQREQIGIDGVETLEDMLQVKRKVADGAEKAVILNADDPLTRALMDDYPAERVIAFSMGGDSPAVREIVARGSAALVARDGAEGEEITLLSKESDTRLLSVAELPSTMDGRHRVNLANAMAAAGLAHGLGIDLETIAAGLRAYRLPRPGEPGRMIWIKDRPYDVLIDWAQNAAALDALGDTLSRLEMTGRRVCLLSAPSNRPDWSFEEIGQAVARSFDVFICYDRPSFVRGQAPGHIATRLRAGLISAGVPEAQVLAVPEPEEALRTAEAQLRPDDFLALLGGPMTYLVDLFSR